MHLFKLITICILFILYIVTGGAVASASDKSGTNTYSLSFGPIYGFKNGLDYPDILNELLAGETHFVYSFEDYSKSFSGLYLSLGLNDYSLRIRRASCKSRGIKRWFYSMELDPQQYTDGGNINIVKYSFDIKRVIASSRIWSIGPFVGISYVKSKWNANLYSARDVPIKFNNSFDNIGWQLGFDARFKMFKNLHLNYMLEYFIYKENFYSNGPPKQFLKNSDYYIDALMVSVVMTVYFGKCAVNS